MGVKLNVHFFTQEENRWPDMLTINDHIWGLCVREKLTFLRGRDTAQALC